MSQEKLCQECRQRPAERPCEQLLKCRECWTSATCLVCGCMRAAWGGRCLEDGVRILPSTIRIQDA